MDIEPGAHALQGRMVEHTIPTLNISLIQSRRLNKSKTTILVAVLWVLASL